MRTLCASVLAFEALVVALAIVPALTLVDGHGTLIVGGGLAVVALCLVAAGTLRTTTGYVLGSIVQVLVVGAGLVLPAMFVLGGLFALLWVSAILLAQRAERIVAEKAAQAAKAGRADGTGPSAAGGDAPSAGGPD